MGMTMASFHIDTRHDLPFRPRDVFWPSCSAGHDGVGLNFRSGRYRQATEFQVAEWFERQAKVLRRKIADERHDLMMARLRDALAVVEQREVVASCC